MVEKTGIHSPGGQLSAVGQLQFREDIGDYGDGQLIDGRKTWLWRGWLAWSRYRVVSWFRVLAFLEVHPS